MKQAAGIALTLGVPLALAMPFVMMDSRSGILDVYAHWSTMLVSAAFACIAIHIGLQRPPKRALAASYTLLSLGSLFMFFEGAVPLGASLHRTLSHAAAIAIALGALLAFVGRPELSAK